jgi:hypothetical protein
MWYATGKFASSRLTQVVTRSGVVFGGDTGGPFSIPVQWFSV